MTGPSDAELFSPRRFPVLGSAGRSMLRHLVDHPQAPHYRDLGGHQLTRTDIWRARWRHWQLLRSEVPWPLDATEGPEWAAAWLRGLERSLPAARGLAGRPWAAWPTVTRADLAFAPTLYTPAGAPARRTHTRLTQGTTGHPLALVLPPGVAADEWALQARALEHFGVVPRARAGQVGLVRLAWQAGRSTHACVNPLRGESGVALLDLAPAEWRSADDRRLYLDALAPELLSGDTAALAELLRLGLRHRPGAVLSTGQPLNADLRRELEWEFRCPVLDVYALAETGPVGVFDPQVDGFVLLQPRLHVEVVDAAGQPLPYGQAGEVTLSGGINPLLPLMRYRTGDLARLDMSPRGPVLRDLAAHGAVALMEPT